MSHKENLARRLQAALELLKENPDGIYNKPGPAGVFQRVTEIVPLDENEQETVPSGGQRGNVNFSYGSHDLVGAGWLRKEPGGTGLWNVTDDGLAALESYPDAIEFHDEAKARYKVWSEQNQARKDELLRSIIVPRHKAEESVRTTSTMFMQRGLQEGDSVFSPGRPVWARGCVDELLTNYVAVTDVEGDNYLDRLQHQLAGLGDDAKLLLAELTTWQLLPISRTGMGERVKLARIEAALDSMKHPVQLPSEVLATLKDGVFHPGMGMIGQPHAVISLAVRFLDNWLKLSSDQRAAPFEDPRLWKQIISEWMGAACPTQRNSFLYTVAPEYFTSIVPDTDKREIRNAFLGEISAATDDVDQDLFDIVIRLQQKENGPVDFYLPKYRKRWQSKANADLVPPPPDAADVPSKPRSFPAASDDMSSKLHIDKVWLEKQLNLLERRRQLVLYGPPGTGKTFIAMAIADYVTGDEKYTELVQFHPSYSYEDFFEGYRPVTSDEGNLTYELRWGPLRRMVNDALENSEFNYVLVIDELNRGNLAKVFGELYFLLEYRHRRINLQYSNDDFELPENLFIIGTMNTADRSIALMDSAMRRRFAFVELHPDSPPTSAVLPNWLAANRLDPEAADLLRQLNLRIEDPSFRIGPSYLMPKDGVLDESTMNQIWESEILPLMEEHHFGDGTNIDQRYGLAALRRATAESRNGDQDSDEPDY